MEEYIEEFGSSFPIRFAKATLYDENGQEIDIPTCDNCGNKKASIIGKDHCAWICWKCG